MRYLFRILAAIVISAVFALPSAAVENNCQTCHVDWEDDGGPASLWDGDIHKEIGLTCADCHGGDPTLEDMDDVRGGRSYRGVPTTLEIPDFCGRCHSDPVYMKKYNPSVATDQLDKYRTSIHGKLNKKGDVKAATCVSCHTVHAIQPAKIPSSSVYPMNLPGTCAECHANPIYMKPYDIPTDQYDKFVRSVHGRQLLEKEDIGAPACNDCHGNHGAAPPGLDNISAVCGTCHARHAMLFSDSPHKEAYEREKLPQCEACHSNHDIIQPIDEMVGVGEKAFCSRCHDAEMENKGFETAAAISDLLDSLVRIERLAEKTIDEAELKGMSVDDERFALKDIRSALVESRTLIHSFDIEQVKPEAEKGIQLAAATHLRGLEIIEDYYFRRKGLAVSTIIITLLAVVIWIKIKQFDNS